MTQDKSIQYKKVILVIVVVALTFAVLYFGATWVMAQMQGHMPRLH